MTDAAAPAPSAPAPNGGAAPSASPPSTAVTKAGLMGEGTAAPLTPAGNNGSAASSQSGSPEIVMTQDANGDWRQSFATGLDDDTRNSWQSITKNYNSQADVVKAHVSLVKSMRDRIPVPGENAKPEEWDAVYNRLGRPETAEGYKWNFPADAPWGDDVKGRFKELAPLFHKQRATQAQLDAYLEQQAQLDKVAEDAAKAKANTLALQHDRQMQAEWRGDDYKANMSFAKASVERYFGDDTDAVASLRLDDGTFVLDRPEFRRAFARIGRERAEDDRDPSAFTSSFRGNIDGQIAQLEQDALSKGLTPSSRSWPHQQIEELMRKKNGTKNLYAHS